MKKKNNNLVAIIYKDGETKYYTSPTTAGLKVGLANRSVTWAIEHGNVCTDFNDRGFIIKIVDGSEVPYKLINN